MKKTLFLLFVSFALIVQSAEQVDLSAVHRIRYEAFSNGKVMDHLFYLSDVYGPRLTASPGFNKAAEWAVQELKSWGMSSAHLESWGKFGRSWSIRRFDAHIVQPFYSPVMAYPNAWCDGTSGVLRADLVYAPLFQWWEDDDRRDPAKFFRHIKDFTEKYKGQLRGKIVMIDPKREIPQTTTAPSERYDEKALTTLEQAPEPFALVPYEWPITHLPDDPKIRDRFYTGLPLEVRSDFWDQVDKARDAFITLLRDEGAVGVFTVSRTGIGGTWNTTDAASFRSGDPVSPPSISLQREQYDRLARMLEKKMQVTTEMDLQVDFPSEDVEATNVIAEIPGGKKKDELVMLGGHLDSWHSGTGATDNGAGCAVAMEAMRILKTLGLAMDRTVRLALWSGEEQGLMGSRAYIKQHFADPVTMKLKPEQAKVSGYFNLDNGSGKIRGVYLQDNDMMRPIFKDWFEPFADLGADTIVIRNTGGTDHLSFDAVGIPGFQFIQDPLDYDTRTHHSNIDVYDHAEPGDLMQASAIMATFVYNTANRAEMLPRKPLPNPLPPKKESANP